MKLRISNQGFTLTELLVAMVISGVVAAGIYSTFYSQQKSYMTQEQVAAMQQNLRGAMHLLGRDIRMAGYNPTGWATTGIQTADAASIRFTRDITNDAGTGVPDGDTGDPNEDITYALVDLDGDGDTDLGRNDANGGGNHQIAENIDALNFIYLDKEGNPTSTLSEIRAVQVSVLARTDRRDQGYQNTNVYENQQGTSVFTPPAGDGFRRRLLTEEFKCRNLGLD
ncbi:MAG: prepilin-type N-terminal cleavage/methylation domain-containing protein [Deltaproteobacteria bacterium]|nr:MAG: prepilin-type N-terminal cleavage/methylation domain-containing protein [Deltaproteobacteria bacterium]